MTQKSSLSVLSAPLDFVTTLTLPLAAQNDSHGGEIVNSMIAHYTVHKSFQSGFTQTSGNSVAKFKQNINGKLAVGSQKHHLMSSRQKVNSDDQTPQTYLEDEAESILAVADTALQMKPSSKMLVSNKERHENHLLTPPKEGILTHNQIELVSMGGGSDGFQLLVGHDGKSLASLRSMRSVQIVSFMADRNGTW